MKTHIGLNVTNIPETVKFYNSFFGQEANKVKPDYAKYELEEAGLVISFIEKPGNVDPSFAHFGFRVDSTAQLNKRLEAAIKNEIVHLEEMGTGCCYARQDKFWVKDPDGYKWEIYTFLEDIEENEPQTACCA